MKNYINFLLILVPGTVWGASFVVTNAALDYFQPFTLGLGRWSISAIFLAILLYYLGGRLPETRAEWVDIIKLAVLNMSGFLLTAWGQLTISSGLTTILAATIPFFTLVVAHFATDDDKINLFRTVGIGLGLIGVVILIGVNALNDLGDQLLAQLAILLAAALYGMGGVYARGVLDRQAQGSTSSWIPRIRVITVSQICSVLIVLPLTLLIDRPWERTVPFFAYGYLLALGIGVTTFAILIFYYLVQTVGSSTASMTMYITPVSGVVLGVLLLGEVITPSMPIAALFILGGVFIVTRPRRPLPAAT